MPVLDALFGLSKSSAEIFDPLPEMLIAVSLLKVLPAFSDGITAPDVPVLTAAEVPSPRAVRQFAAEPTVTVPL